MLNTEEMKGRNLIVQVAIRILSIIANSAACERAFSSMGRTHSKIRNRLDPRTVHKVTVLKGHLDRTNAKESLQQGPRPSRKRRYAPAADPSLAPVAEAESETPSLSSVSHPPAAAAAVASPDVDGAADFDDFVADLLRQLDDEAASEREEVLRGFERNAAERGRVNDMLDREAAESLGSNQASTTGLDIPLEKLFKFSNNRALQCLHMFWDGGLHGLQREGESHDILFTPE
jgi:hypothetical protein